MASKADYGTDLPWEVVPVETPDDGGEASFAEMGNPVVAAFRDFNQAKRFLVIQDMDFFMKYKIRKCPVD